MRVNDLAGRRGSATRPTVERDSLGLMNGFRGLRNPSLGQAVLARRVTLRNSQGTCQRTRLLGGCVDGRERSITYTGTHQKKRAFSINQPKQSVPQGMPAYKSMKFGVAALRSEERRVGKECVC